jgi:hypothetical protein
LGLTRRAVGLTRCAVDLTRRAVGLTRVVRCCRRPVITEHLGRLVRVVSAQEHAQCLAPLLLPIPEVLPHLITSLNSGSLSAAVFCALLRMVPMRTHLVEVPRRCVELGDSLVETLHAPDPVARAHKDRMRRRDQG